MFVSLAHILVRLPRTAENVFALLVSLYDGDLWYFVFLAVLRRLLLLSLLLFSDN